MYITEGKLAALISFIFIFVVLLIYYMQALKGKSFTIKRRIIPLEMIPVAVGRAVEMGRPMHGTTGGSTTTSWRGPHVVAGMAMMEYIAEFASNANIPFWVSPLTGDQIVLADDALRSGYARGDNPEAFKQEYIVFHGEDDGAFISGCFGLMNREKPAANFLLGGFGGEAILLAEEGNRLGAFQVAGTPATWQLPFFATTCDYVMMADELFAAGCIISGDQAETSLIIALDMLKIVIVALTVIGTVAITFGNDLIHKMLVI